MKLNERQQSLYDQIMGAAKWGKMEAVNWIIKSLEAAVKIEDKYKLTNKEICELLEILPSEIGAK